jgi:hypothetical protein
MIDEYSVYRVGWSKAVGLDASGVVSLRLFAGHSHRVPRETLGVCRALPQLNDPPEYSDPKQSTPQSHFEPPSGQTSPRQSLSLPIVTVSCIAFSGLATT